MALSERLASLGTLAAGMCHEINNPLTFIIANAYFLQEAVDAWREAQVHGDSPELAEQTLRAGKALTDLSEGAERIRRIVADLTVFGRAEDDPLETFDPRESARWALRVARVELQARARIVEHLEPVPLVKGSQTRLTQVLINLMVNAAHAIAEGDVAGNAVRIATRFEPDVGVLVTVEDTGQGIDKEELPHIFDPFFTTKAPGLGSGLGLSICYGIVQSLGGEIRVRSRPGRGSRFEIVLPAACDVSAVAAPGAPHKEARRGRILVVDDEASYLRAVELLLRDHHEITVASNGRQALDRLEAGESFDLVLCDVTMPVLNGMELFERAVLLDPSLKKRFIFVTGGSFTPRTTEFLSRVQAPQLQKPFDPPALLAHLQEWLRNADDC